MTYFVAAIAKLLAPKLIRWLRIRLESHARPAFIYLRVAS